MIDLKTYGNWVSNEGPISLEVHHGYGVRNPRRMKFIKVKSITIMLFLLKVSCLVKEKRDWKVNTKSEKKMFEIIFCEWL